MSRPPQAEFAWRGFVVVAVGFALIALVIMFRGGAAAGGAFHPKEWMPGVAELDAFGKVLGVGMLFLLAAVFGCLFGYLRVISRSRRDSEASGCRENLNE